MKEVVNKTLAEKVKVKPFKKDIELNPQKYPSEKSKIPHDSYITHDGIMLMDDFAGLAMAGLIAQKITDVDAMAELSYRYANAMLEARQKVLESLEKE